MSMEQEVMWTFILKDEKQMLYFTNGKICIAAFC